MSGRKILRTTFKVFLWILGIIFGILIIAIIALQIPSVQHLITQKAVTFLEGKLKTKVSVAEINVGFPKYIVIKKLYAEDQKHDTLLYADKLSVDLDFWALKEKNINVNKIKLEQTTAHINRLNPDSAFNYDFIVKAFTSSTPKVKDTTVKPWEFKIEKIDLQKIFFSYKDDKTKNDINLRLGEFFVSFDKFDLSKSTYLVNKIELSHTNFYYSNLAEPTSNLVDTNSVVKNNNAVNNKLITALKKLSLNDIHVYYHDKASGQTLKADVGKSFINADKLDIDGQNVEAQQFTLSNTKIDFRQDAIKKIKKNKGPERTATPAAPGWKMKLEELNLEGNEFIYDDFNKVPQKEGVDFSHLNISNINITSDHIEYAGDTIKANIKELSAKEKSGLIIKNFKTDFFLDDKRLQASGLVLQTSNSNLIADVRADYKSFANISKDYPAMLVQGEIKESKFAVQDVMYFQPDLLKKMPIHVERNTILYFKTKIHGQVKDLRIDELVAGTLNDTQISINGNIKNLPDIDRSSFNLNIAPFETSSSDLRYLLPPKILPRSVSLPNNIKLTSKLQGAFHNFKLNADLITSLGNIIADINLASNQKFSNGTYKGLIKIENLALGKIIKQEKTIGKLNMNIGFDGSGFKKEEMNARVATVINSLQYNKYNYHNVIFNADAKPSFFAGKLNINDPNITLILKASADFRNQIPRYIADLDLKNAVLKKLNLTKKDIRSRLKVTADLKYKDLNNINGNIGIRKVAVVSAGKVYLIDSLLYVSIQEKAKTDIKINSDIMSGYFKGNINLSGIYGELENHFNTYFETHEKKDKKATSQNFDFKIELKNPEILTDILIPNLDSLQPGVISGKFDSQKKELDFKTEIYGLKYSGIKADSIQLNIKSDVNKLNANFSVARVQKSNIILNRTSIKAFVKDDNIQTRLDIRDSVDKVKYAIAGLFKSINSEYFFHLNPDSLELNYKPWQVANENSIHFGKNGLIFHDLVLSSRDQKLIIDNVNKQPSSINVGFDNFKLATIGEIFQSDTSFLAGTLNGFVKYYHEQRDTILTSDLKINKFAYIGMPVGDIAINADRKSDSRVDAKLTLSGNQNDLNISGFYNTSASAASPLNFEAVINKLNLASVAPFIQTQVKQLTGMASGDMTIGGSSKSPIIKGKLTFDTTTIKPSYLNTVFKINKQSLNFDPQGLHLNNFVLKYSANNQSVVSGDVLTQDYSYFTFNLNFSTNQFQVMNTSYKDNKLYYGKIFLNSQLTISGDSYKPVVDGNLKITGQSNFTYVVQQTTETVTGQKGIVTFVDGKADRDPFVKQMKNQTKKDTLRSELKGFELSANIEIDTTSTLQVVIDPVAGDQLKVKGQTTLSLTIDPAGSIDLTGRYQILSGTYNLSFFGLLKRQFTIDNTSSIIWSGDPYDATLDINATYTVVATAMELVKDQLTSSSPGDLNRYKQKFPFLVRLHLKGRLTQPSVSFTLDMPPSKQNVLEGIVYAKIQELNTRESELNKQVFALFLLQRFLAEDPLESTSTGIEDNVRGSVSKLLTQQLNNLAGQIKGVQLSLDLNSRTDYSTGQAQGNTKLQLGVSKNLFNDRVVVKVAGNVNIEGSSTTNQDDISSFLGDLILEYKLTPDGRFRLEGFRQRTFDLVSGELIQTGGGIIFVRDYNALRELFSSTVKE